MTDRPHKTPSGFIDEGRPVDFADLRTWTRIWNEMPERFRYYPSASLVCRLGWQALVDHSDGHIVCMPPIYFGDGPMSGMSQASMIQRFNRELVRDGSVNVHRSVMSLVPDFTRIAEHDSVSEVNYHISRHIRNDDPTDRILRSVVDSMPAVIDERNAL